MIFSKLRYNNNGKLNKINKYLNLFSGFNTSISNTLISMCNSYISITPSQQFLANTSSCSLRTVSYVTKELNDLNIIKKRKRGWFKVDPESNTFIARTCEYSLGKQFIADMKYIYKYSSKSDPLLLKLISRIPSLQRIFDAFCVVYNLIFKKYINYINKESLKDNKLSLQVLNQKDFFLKKRINEELHTSTLSSLYSEVDYNDLPPLDTIEYSQHDYMQFYSRKAGMEVDLRYCTENDYIRLSQTDKKIAHRYFYGRRFYKSVSNYENNLKKVGQQDKIWYKNTTKLTAEQVNTIKKFPQQILDYIKQELRKNTKHVNDYNWIYYNCIDKCKMENLDIRNLLYKHGFDKIAQKVFKNPTLNEIKTNCSNEKQPLPINDAFRRLVGDEAINLYKKRANLDERKEDSTSQ